MNSSEPKPGGKDCYFSRCLTGSEPDKAPIKSHHWVIGREAKASRLDEESETVVGLLQLVSYSVRRNDKETKIEKIHGNKVQTVDPQQLQGSRQAIRSEILSDSALIFQD